MLSCTLKSDLLSTPLSGALRLVGSVQLLMGVRLLVGIWPPRSSIIMVCVSVSTKNISFGVTAAGAPKILLLLHVADLPEDAPRRWRRSAAPKEEGAE